MGNWKQTVRVVPASECRVEGELPADIVANYRVYFPGGDRRTPYDPYHDGIVIEEWKDGRFYIIDGSVEVTDKSLNAVEEIAENLARDNGYIDKDGNVTALAKTNEALAAEALALSDDPHWGSQAQIDAQNEFCERVKSRVSAKQWAVFEEFCLKATSAEIIEEGLSILADQHKDLRDCAIPSDFPAPTPDAADAPVEADSVQALFDSLFPNFVPRIRIRGGGEIQVESVCGRQCALTLRVAHVLTIQPEIEKYTVARLAADACEVYING